jgi:hypothetical protein
MPQKPGRPKGSTKNNSKTVIKGVRFTPDELAEIEAAAGEFESSSHFIRKSAVLCARHKNRDGRFPLEE